MNQGLRFGHLFGLGLVTLFGCASSQSSQAHTDTLRDLVLPANATVPKDVTNRYADDPKAAALGKKFFYEKRFSGPLLDDSNDGLSQTLGAKGETGKVSCSGCHTPESNGFFDARSPRNQVSLGADWTKHKAPSLLDVGQARLLTWSGRRDAAYNQVFAPVESGFEFNSSRLFVAQQITRLYKKEYEEIFGPLPSLSKYPVLDASKAGCTEERSYAGVDSEICPSPGQDDEEVTRVLVNFGKAIQAFTRTLSCGRGRFDRWMDGDATALTADEQAGAQLFIGKADCSSCHSGPYLTDQKFHNLGVPGEILLFSGVNTANDPGAAAGIAKAREDWLNSKGRFSDGYDGRLDAFPQDLTSLNGAFRTPSLRCVGRRSTFMHNAEFRSLKDVIDFFSNGGLEFGGEPTFVGHSINYPRNLTDQEKEQLLAFLMALDGEGPNPSALEPPVLPP